jgi:hypothetical protein
LLAAVAACGYGQTAIDLRTQSKSVDFSAASSTRPMKTGTTLPATCVAGEMFFKTDAPAGSNLYGCVATNTWTLQAGGGGGGTGEANTVANVGTGGLGLYLQKQGVEFQFKTLNTGSNRVALTNDTLNKEIDIDVVPANIDIATLGGLLVPTQVGATHKQGTGTRFQMFGGGTAAANDCAKFDANGNIVSAGAACASGGEVNTASNAGVGGVSVYLQKSGADLQFKSINAGSSRVTVSNDAVNREVDIDIAPGNINISTLGGQLNLAQISSSNKQGDGTRIQMFGGGAVAVNDCAKFDANGNLVSAGGPCGTGTGGAGGGAYGANRTASTTWTVAGSEHGMGTCDLSYEIYGPASGGVVSPVQPNSITCNTTNYDVTVSWATAQSGRIVIFSGQGGGTTECTNCVLTTNSYANPSWLQSVAYAKIDDVPKTGSGGMLVSAASSPSDGCATWQGGNLTSTGTACGTSSGGGSGTPGGTNGQIQVNNNGVFGGLGLGYGLQVAGGVLQVNPASVPTFLSASAQIDFGSIAQSACAEANISMPGAMIGDAVIPGWPQNLDAGFIGVMRVSVADTINVRLCKITSGALDPPAQSYRAVIVRAF